MPKQKTNREEILKDSLLVFTHKGYHKATMADLAEACGLEKPHFYYYFKNKKALMVEVLKFSRQKMQEWVLSKAYDEAFTPEQRIRKMAQNLVKIHSSNFDGCIMGNTILEVANTEPDLLPYVRGYFDDFLHAFKHIYQTKHTEIKAEELAKATLREVQGSTMLMRLHQNSDYLIETADRIIRNVVDMEPLSVKEKALV